MRQLLFRQTRAPGIAPAPVQRRTEREQVEPIDKQREALGQELPQQHRREWHHRGCKQEGEMDPANIPVAAREMPQLRLLPGPEYPERQKSHGEHQEPRRHLHEPLRKVLFAVNPCGIGQLQIKDQQGHRNRKQPVAQGRNALEAAAGNLVVGQIVMVRCFPNRPPGPYKVTRAQSVRRRGPNKRPARRC
jgi:hypothetical protein